MAMQRTTLEVTYSHTVSDIYILYNSGLSYMSLYIVPYCEQLQHANGWYCNPSTFVLSFLMECAVI